MNYMNLLDKIMLNAPERIMAYDVYPTTVVNYSDDNIEFTVYFSEDKIEIEIEGVEAGYLVYKGNKLIEGGDERLFKVLKSISDEIDKGAYIPCHSAVIWAIQAIQKEINRAGKDKALIQAGLDIVKENYAAADGYQYGDGSWDVFLDIDEDEAVKIYVKENFVNMYYWKGEGKCAFIACKNGRTTNYDDPRGLFKNLIPG